MVRLAPPMIRSTRVPPTGRLSAVEHHDADRNVAPEIIAHYSASDEGSRLANGLGLVERDRTRRLVGHRLPPPPAVVLDVGCGAGVHAVWLAARGYEVHAVDPVARHVHEAATAAAERGVELASARVGDASELGHGDTTVDAVLAFGPLYHLQERSARATALAEARRVLRPGGWFFGAAISAFASMVSAFREGLLADQVFLGIVEGDLATGRHDNPTGDPGFFTTAFAHRPEQLASELEDAGFDEVEVVAIEGLAWAIDDVDSVWSAPDTRTRLMELLDSTEREPSVLGASTHLMGVGRRPEHGRTRQLTTQVR